MRIFLMGYMGSGKSTFGKKLANKLGLQFHDLDNEIEQSEQSSISTIFSAKGESYFRKKEKEHLLSFCNKDNILLSLGGGTPCFDENIKLITKNGISVYLKMNPKSIFSRLKNAKSKRPLIQHLNDTMLLEYIQNHLMEREPFYSQADITIDGLTLNAMRLESLAEELEKFKA